MLRYFRKFLYNCQFAAFSKDGDKYVVQKEGSAGQFKPVAFCPGFVRGLAFCGDHAFVGLSKPRYKRFEGLEMDRRLKEKDTEAWCGIQVIDCKTGTCVDWFRIDDAVDEIYDIALLEQVGPAIGRRLRRRQSQPGDIWHLDEVVVTIKGRKFWLWRSVDQNGVVLDEILQTCRDTAAAKRLLTRLMKK